MSRRDKEQEDVAKWLEKIGSGLDYRKEYGKETDWTDNEAMFNNAYTGMDQYGGPNLIVSQGDTMMSNLSVPYPWIQVDPERWDCIPGSDILTRLDNQLVKKLKLRRETEQGTLHGFLYGKLIWKIGYDSEWGWDPLEDPLEGQGGFTATQFNKKGESIEFRETVKPGMPWVKAVMPHDIVVPWGTVWMDEAEWVAHRVVRHIDDVKADPKYSSKDLEPIMSMEDFQRSYKTVMKPYRMGNAVPLSRTYTGEDAAEYVELWEIHDKRSGKVLVVSTGHDRFLRNDTDYLQVRGLPFVAVNFVPNSRSFWVTPDASYLRQPQFELTDITVQAAKQRRLSTLKMMYQEGALDEGQLERMLSSTVGAGIKVNAGHDIDKAIRWVQATQNPQIYMEAEQTRRNAREISGTSRNQSGEFEATGRRTATEAQVVDQSSKLRSGRRGTKIEDLYIDSFQIINGLLQEYWRTPRVIDIMGPDGEQNWVRFVGEQLKGEYSYSCSLTENPPMGPRARQGFAMQVYQASQLDPSIDPIAVRNFLASAMGDPRFSAIFKPGIVRGGQPNAVPVQMPGLPGPGSGSPAGGGPAQTQAM